MGLINTVKNVLDDIKMKHGLDKCAKTSFKRGKKGAAKKIPLNDNQVIQDLDQVETYKCLEMEEGEGLQYHNMKVKIRKGYKRRIKLVLNSQINGLKEQDSNHQYPTIPSNPLQLWSHWFETKWDTGPWQDDQEATVYEPDASKESIYTGYTSYAKKLKDHSWIWKRHTNPQW